MVNLPEVAQTPPRLDQQQGLMLLHISASRPSPPALEDAEPPRPPRRPGGGAGYAPTIVFPGRTFPPTSQCLAPDNRSSWNLKFAHRVKHWIFFFFFPFLFRLSGRGGVGNCIMGIGFLRVCTGRKGEGWIRV